MEERNFGHLGFTFQQSLIKAIVEDKIYGQSIIDVLETKFFDNSSFKFIIENIKELYCSYNKIPNYDTIAQKIMSETSGTTSNRIHIDTLELIKDNNKDIEFVKDRALNFCKQQNLKKELKLVNNIIENGNFEEYHKIEQIIQKALQIGIVDDDAEDVFLDIDLALEKDFREPIPTGVVGIDNLLKGGLGRCELGLIIAPTGVGKALPITENVLTPNGWVLMGDIKVGDEVVGSDGNKQLVTGVYPQGIRPIYNVIFTDGTKVKCDEEHLWSVNSLNMRTKKARKDENGVTYYSSNNDYKVLKTSEMMKSLKKRGTYNYRLPSIKPIDFNEKEVKINPYLLGLLLGQLDDLTTITIKDDEIFKNIEHLNLHNSVNENKVISFKSSIKNDLSYYKLLEKQSIDIFIPQEYLYNTLEIRVSLLQGMMDAYGYVSKNGVPKLTTVSKELAHNVRELVLSLGGTVKISGKVQDIRNDDTNIIGLDFYTLTILFSNDIQPFTLKRKIDKVKNQVDYRTQKFIKSIDYSHDEEAVCIKVSNDDELFVVNDYVLTHNTSILTKFANTGFNHDYNVLQIFFEDNPAVIKRKHFTIWTGVEPDDQHEYANEVKEKVIEAKSRSKGELRLLKFPSDSVTVSDIKSKIRKMRSEGFNLDLLIIDYVDCISTAKSTNGEEWKGEGSVMRSLEAMSTEFNIAIWCATQGGRESISSEVVTTDQMGGSIKKGQIAHVILSIAKTLEQKEHNLATIAVLKSRIGKDGVIFQNSKFDNKLLIIDTESNNTLLGIEEDKQRDNTNRAREAFFRRQEMNN